MESKPTGWTLSGLAQILGGTFEGPADLRLERPVPPHSDDPEGVTFARERQSPDWRPPTRQSGDWRSQGIAVPGPPSPTNKSKPNA